MSAIAPAAQLNALCTVAVLVRRLVLALVLTPLSAAPAGAATVTVDPCVVKGCYASGAVVLAAPGEANRIRASLVRGTSEVSDAGAPLLAGDGCEETAAGTVRCESVVTIHVAAGDGDDRVEILADASSLGSRLDGGPGDDVLVAADGDDRLHGGGGTDSLFGGNGDDELVDGDAPSAPDGDTLDGGAGSDLVDYGARTRPVRVLLDASGFTPTAGEAGEHDRLHAMEGAHGGSAADVLRASDGGASPDTFADVDGDTPGLKGGPGADRLIGGRSDDRIDASEGADRVRAGRGGDDVVLPYDEDRKGARAVVDCGRGFDLVANAAPADRLGRCDLVYLDEAGTAFGIDTATWVRIVQRDSFGRRFRVAVRVDGGRLDGRLLARRDLRSQARRLGVTALGRRLARRRTRPALRVLVRYRSGRRDGFRLSAQR